MGHLLLRELSHSGIGIMSYPVTAQYLTKAARSQLLFTASQAKRMRKEVRKRTEQGLAGSVIVGAPAAMRPRNRN
jgi:hypothetical protein